MMKFFVMLEVGMDDPFFCLCVVCIAGAGLCRCKGRSFGSGNGEKPADLRVLLFAENMSEKLGS